MCDMCEYLGTTCDAHAYEQGSEDAEYDEPYRPTYKNWSQVNAYRDGWETVKPIPEGNEV